MFKKILMLLILVFIGSSAYAEDFAGCEEADFEYVDSGKVTVEITGFSYSPKCLRVLPGTEVTISAAPRHPLEGETLEGQPNSLIEGQVTHTQTYTYSELGNYAYYCVFHQGLGMKGSIQVVEEKDSLY